jgi:4-hydroxybenzoate polyprenyltransferase
VVRVAAERRVAALALLGACHPVPCVAVTTFAVALAAKAGCPAPTCAIVAVAVGAGQLSIGWSNDRIDAGRDRVSGRTDKPVASGRVPSHRVDVAIGAALAVTVAASLLLGWRAGLLHLAAVGCAWAYNAGLKATLWSWLPYALAFGSLPAIATLASAHGTWAPLWAVIAAAALGVSAHIMNVAPDLDDDRRAGVHGLPQRLGRPGMQVVAGVGLLLGSATAVLGPPGDPSALRWVGLALTVAVTAAALAVSITRPRSAWGFYLTIVVGGLDVLLLILGPSLTP